MDILLIPCIIRKLKFVFRLGSFFRKKYPNTGPRLKYSLRRLMIDELDYFKNSNTSKNVQDLVVMLHCYMVGWLYGQTAV